MKLLFKIINLVTVFSLMVSCDAELDEFEPHNLADEETFLTDVSNIVNATSGAYGLFLDQTGGFTNSYNYYESYYILSEFRANNVIFAEPFNAGFANGMYNVRCPDAHFFLNSDQKNQSFAWPVWAKTLQMMLYASKNITAIDKLIKEVWISDEERNDLKRLKGENLFLRGLMISNALNVFSRPYWDDPEHNLGIPLDINGEGLPLPRATVQECYEQAIADFEEAASDLPDEQSNRTYANRAACYGMLSRLYLNMGGLPESPNMEYNTMAVEYANKVFNLNDVVQLVSSEDIQSLFEKPSESKELLFSFWQGNFQQDFFSNLIHNYYDYGGLVFFQSTQVTPAVISEDYIDIIDTENDLRWQHLVASSTRHPSRKITAKFSSGKTSVGGFFDGYNSPVVYIRAAEVILNRAEAYVKLGNDAAALNDLNTIRERAGLNPISGLSGNALFNEIFVERRRELAFEGHTFYDYVRNGMTMTRNEISSIYQNYTDIKFNEIDSKASRRTMNLIPQEEIQLNPLLIQNDY